MKATPPSAVPLAAHKIVIASLRLCVRCAGLPPAAPSAALRALRRGFTLIEVSLALLVVAVGVLGAFALFPHGLAESKAAIEQTHASLFAEMVMRSYRAASIYAPWSAINDYRVPVPGEGLSGNDEVWDGTSRSKEIVPNTASPQTYINSMTIAAAQGGGQSGEVEETALRYQIQIEDVVANRLKRMTLWVWPGRFGATDVTNADIYVTQFYNQQI
jgi:prepilin-type N-terminal cleavage/methylation domain-containing protein